MTKLVIFKYEMNPETPLVVDLPADSVPLTVAFQNRKPCVWIQVPLNVIQIDTFVFGLVATGEAFTLINRKYIGSCVSDAVVWHAYMIRMHLFGKGEPT